jgi:hypothetical protein
MIFGLSLRVRALKPAKKLPQIILSIAMVELFGHVIAKVQDAEKRSSRFFFKLPLELQLEYLPYLNPWFFAEHREKVQKPESLKK